MSEKTFPVLTAILVILLGTFVLAAYLVYQGNVRPEKDAFSGALRGTSTSTSQVLGATTTPVTGTQTQARPSAVSQPTQTTRAQNNLPAAAAASRPATTATIQPQGRECTANDLSGMTAWGSFGQSLEGVMRIRNSSNSDCVLSRFSNLSLFSGYRLLADRQASRPLAGLLIPRGEERTMRFVWSDWCGGPLSAPSYAVLSLPGAAGYLRVPFIDSDGDPQYDVPLCREGRTALDVWW